MKFIFNAFSVFIHVYVLWNCCCGNKLTDSDTNVTLFVKGNGFHRNFTYKIQTIFNTPDCYIGLHLNLPPSLFVNEDELNNLRRTKKNLICSKGERNIESFAEKSLPQKVSVCSPSNNIVLLSIPIHQRYQYATSDGGYKNIAFPEIELYLGCQHANTNLKIADIDLCSPCSELVTNWHSLPYNFMNETYIWRVPVGQTTYSRLVIFITLFTTLVGAIFILKTMWRMEFAECKED